MFVTVLRVSPKKNWRKNQ